MNHDLLLLKTDLQEALTLERQDDVRQERELAVSALNQHDLPMAALATRLSQGFRDFMVMRDRAHQAEVDRLLTSPKTWTP